MKQWLPERHTIGDLISAVMRIDNEKDAQSFWDWQVDWIQRQINAKTWEGRDNAVDSARANIGWCFGEGMSQDRIAMWSKVCEASHPVFGQMLPSSQDAFESGKKYAAH